MPETSAGAPVSQPDSTPFVLDALAGQDTGRQPSEDSAPEQPPEDNAVGPEQTAQESEPTPEPSEEPKTEGLEQPKALELDPAAKYLIGDKELTGEEIKKGLMLQEDYTRKTQALAEERKLVQQQQTSLTELMRQYLDAAAEWQKFLQRLAVGDVEINWDELAKENPEEYVRQRHYYDARVKKVNELISQLEADRQRIQQTLLQQHLERVYTLLPEWRNPDIARTESQKVIAYLRKIGETDEAISAASPALIYAAYQAAKRQEELDKAQKARVSAPAPKPVRQTVNAPSTPNQDRYIDGTPMLRFPSLERTGR